MCNVKQQVIVCSDMVNIVKVREKQVILSCIISVKSLNHIRVPSFILLSNAASFDM